jgi:bla regulator protein BlaR1
MMARFDSVPIVLEVFWKSSVVLGAALCISGLLRKKSADVRRLVLSIAVVAMFVSAAAWPLLPRLTAVVPFGLRQPPVPAQTHQMAGPASINDEQELTAPDVQSRTVYRANSRIDFKPWLLPMIWFAGAFGLLARFVVNLRGLRRLRNASEPVPGGLPGSRVGLWRNESIAAPVTWGIFRPIILVPAGFEDLPAETRDAVLCHELAHIQAHDFLMRGIAEIARALAWFQPLIWIVRSQLREEQELACDNRVLASGGKPSAYAKLLLDWDARPGMDYLIAVGIANRSCLKRRLYALLDPDLRRDTVAGGVAVGTWVLGLAMAMALAALGFAQAIPVPPVVTVPKPPVQITQAQPVPAPVQAPAPKPAAVPAPAPTPKFDAASIKPCQPGDGPGRSGTGDMGKNGGVDPNVPEGVGGYFRATPGRLDVTCGSILTMVQFAYVGQGGKPLLNNPVTPMRAAEVIKGIPKWALAARYTIHAETDDPVVNGPTQGEAGQGRPPAQALLYGPMLQGLLEDRFQLKIHREVEEAPMYALTVAKSGFKLKPIKDGDCMEMEHVAGGGLILSRGLPGPDDKPYCKWFGWPSHGPNQTLIGDGTIDMLAAELGALIFERQVFDRTGISGVYNIRLEYAPDENTQCIDNRCAVDPNSDIPPGATIFSAIEQQLGLKLEQIKGPKEHIVIDHVDRPSEN